MAEGKRQGLPETLGDYAVLGRLATGGMAELFLARRLGEGGNGRAVAIKTILPHLARNSRFVTMFLDEARIAASIRHPNVAHVDELATDGDELYMVMEYLAGEPVSVLQQRLTRRGSVLDPWVGAYVVAEACAGVHAAHELRDDDGALRNVVHRDLSPQNVFLTYDGAVKILDFGVAKAADRLTATETGTVKGKFEYMSPEQVMDQPLDRRSDVFALGILLFELLSGRRLFRGANDAATVRNVLDRRVDPPSIFTEGVPPALDEVCLKALTRPRQLRYATALEMRHDLMSTICAHRPDVLSGRRLAAIMHELFSGRIATKQEMLRQAREEEVVEVEEIEEEIEIEIPSVMCDTPAVDAWPTDHLGVRSPEGSDASTDPRIRSAEPIADQETRILPLKSAGVDAYPETQVLAPSGAGAAVYPDTQLLPPSGPAPAGYPDTQFVAVPVEAKEPYPDTQILEEPGARAEEEPGALDTTNVMVVADLETKILARPESRARLAAPAPEAGRARWGLALVAITVLGLLVGAGVVIVAPGLGAASRPAGPVAPPARPAPIRPAPTPTPGPALVKAPPPAPAPTPPPTVLVTITSTPGGATVLVDGVTRLTTPGTFTLPRGDRPVSLRLLLDGHVAREEVVVPDADRLVSVTLDPEPPAADVGPADAGASPAGPPIKAPRPRPRPRPAPPEEFELWE